MREHSILIVVRTLVRFISVRILPFARIMHLLVRELLYVREILPVPTGRLVRIALPVRECRQVLAPEQDKDRQILPLSDRRIRPEKKDRAKRRCRVETIIGTMKILIVDRK